MLRTQHQNYPHIDTINPQDTEVFKERYLYKEPVLVKGYIKESIATKIWNEEYFIKGAGNKKVEVSQRYDGNYVTTYMTLEKYLKWLQEDQRGGKTEGENPFGNGPFYLHNFNLAALNEDFLNDLDFNINPFLDKWYFKNWKRSLSIFYGNKNIVNHLHYDALGAHNTFLQIKGHKQFIFIPADQAKYCYNTIKNSNASRVNIENIDYEKYPLFKYVTLSTAILEDGDLLYVPPYTLHHVLGLDLNISVKIDWHCSRSVKNYFTSDHLKEARFHYWNFIFFLGLCCGIPSSILFPLYKSYYKC